MKGLRALLLFLGAYLTGCRATGLVCEDGHKEGFFGDPNPPGTPACGNHGGVDMKATWPDTELDKVDEVARAGNKWFNRDSVSSRDACYQYAEWVENWLTKLGVKGSIILARVSYGQHAAYYVDDNRVLDINFIEPLSLEQWLEFVKDL